jgi:hypothetical protein
VLLDQNLPKKIPRMAKIAVAVAVVAEEADVDQNVTINKMVKPPRPNPNPRLFLRVNQYSRSVDVAADRAQMESLLVRLSKKMA